MGFFRRQNITEKSLAEKYRLDEHVVWFIRHAIKSLVHLEVFIHFYRNRSSIEAPGEIARKIGADKLEVYRAIKDLQKHDILKSLDDEDSAFNYAPAENLKNNIELFIQAHTDDDLRRRILSLVMEISGNE
ncbi:MAG: hypothetical protein JW728_06995 [Candidatus Aureabacteria bacterium]|nr:hypothetical protein [Candidatus Auribacterota bacterium]